MRYNGFESEAMLYPLNKIGLIRSNADMAKCSGRNRKRPNYVVTTFTDAEYAELQEIADERGISMTQLMREAFIAYAESFRKIRRTPEYFDQAAIAKQLSAA